MRFAAFGLALSCVFGSAAAVETACPARVGKSPLSSAALFDGPPEQMADLMPDSASVATGRTTATWTVDYVYKAGRQVHLVCKYDRRSPDSVIRIESPVQHCRFRSAGAGRPAEMGCR